MADHAEVPAALVARVRSVCVALPEVFEEPAWVGTRWKIRTKTFAHVVHVESGWPPAYAAALGADGPADVLTFRSSGPELAALSDTGPPFFKPVWFTDIVGLVLDARDGLGRGGGAADRELLPPRAQEARGVGATSGGVTARIGLRVTVPRADRGVRSGDRRSPHRSPRRSAGWEAGAG